jgi:pyruvate kinase
MKIRTLLLAAAAIALPVLAAAQTMPGHPGAGAMPHDPAMHDMQGMPAHARHAGAAPTEPGQGAYAAVQEIVRILEANPKTDWSKVDLEALRQHLIDMNEVTLRAAEAAHPVEGGVEIAVTGQGRTLEAIQRMVPAQAQMLDHRKGWSAKTAPLADGVLLTVTTKNPRDVAHIRGLGFIGLMATGSYHQRHHLAMAMGEPMEH